MATPLIEFLSEGARAAYGFIEQLAGSSLSANAILSRMAEAGVPIRRQTGLDIIATLRSQSSIPRFLRTFGESAPIPKELYQTAVTKTQNAFTYRVKVTNAPPGMQPAIQMGFDSEMSLDSIFAQATSFLSQASYRGQNVPEDYVPELEFDRAQINPAFEEN